MSVALRTGIAPGRQPLAQGFALEQFHDGKRRALMHAEIMNRENVRVRQRGYRFGFALEARAPLRVAGERCPAAP